MAEIIRAISAQTERQTKFDAVYANNFEFETSVWDLKIILGQLEQHTGKSVVDWHTAVTIPWIQVKLVAYFLRLQAAWYELQNGPISIPASIMPAVPPLPAGDLANDSSALAWYSSVKTIYEETFSSKK